MVKKLFKHEMFYYIRSLFPVYIILIGVALIGRFIACFESDTVSYSILRGSSIFILVIANIATLSLTFVFIISRYYKNMFTGEGYLTLTLPVTATNHLFVKIVTAALTYTISGIFCVLSVCLFTVGKWLNQILTEVANIWNYGDELAGAHLVFFVLELILIAIVSTASEILMIYMCISLGQLFSKNRILAAVGVYFGFYILYQVLSTILSIVFSISSMAWMPQWIDKLASLNVVMLVHSVSGVMFIWSFIIGGIYFLVSRFVLTRKLNLE